MIYLGEFKLYAMDLKILLSKHLVIFVVLVVYNLGAAQPFAIGHTTVTFTDASRGNRNIATEIYYPSDTNGDNVPFTSATADEFPQLIFGHGFVMTWNAYQYLWEMLVPQGFIMALPRTEGSISPSHLEFARDLAFVRSEINNLSSTPTSIFYQRVSNESAVMGHSMGGGAAFLAAQLDNGFSAIVTLAPAETNPSAIDAAVSVAIPALVFAGGNDCVTPPSTNQFPMYNSLVSDCKTYISINGGSHCQMADSNFLCQIAEATCSPSPSISRQQQHDLIGVFLPLWLNAELKGDCVAGGLFNDAIVAGTGVVSEQNCTLCEVLSIEEVASSVDGTIIPNPFSTALQVKMVSKNLIRLKIYDAYGRDVIDREFRNETTLDTSTMATGIYLYTLSNSDGLLKKGKLVRN